MFGKVLSVLLVLAVLPSCAKKVAPPTAGTASSSIETLPSATGTPVATLLPTATPSATPTTTPTATPIATPTSTPTATPTATPTSTPTATPTATPTPTPTGTPTAAAPTSCTLSLQKQSAQGTFRSVVAGEQITTLDLLRFTVDSPSRSVVTKVEVSFDLQPYTEISLSTYSVDIATPARIGYQTYWARVSNSAGTVYCNPISIEAIVPTCTLTAKEILSNGSFSAAVSTVSPGARLRLEAAVQPADSFLSFGSMSLDLANYSSVTLSMPLQNKATGETVAPNREGNYVYWARLWNERNLGVYCPVALEVKRIPKYCEGKDAEVTKHCEDFSDGTAEGYQVRSGDWTASPQGYQAVGANGTDAIVTLPAFPKDMFYKGFDFSIYNLVTAAPVRMKTRVKLVEENGRLSNAFFVFNYKSPTDYKFAGLNLTNARWEIGYVDTAGVHYHVTTPAGVSSAIEYDLALQLNGFKVTLLVNEVPVLYFGFANKQTASGSFRNPPALHFGGAEGETGETPGGRIGFGTQNAKTIFKNQEIVQEGFNRNGVLYSGTGYVAPGKPDTVEVAAGNYLVSYSMSGAVTVVDYANSTQQTLTSPLGPRLMVQVVAAGSRVIAYGGCATTSGYILYNDGAILDPATGQWTLITSAGAPALKYSYKTVGWTGTELLLFAGLAMQPNANGATTYVQDFSLELYNPATQTWRVFSGVNPNCQFSHSIAMPGKLVVYCGILDGDTSPPQNRGIVYDLATGQGTPMPAGGPVNFYGRVPLVSTGQEVIFWDGAQGKILNPYTNTWRDMAVAGGPTPRYEHSAIWTGNRLVIAAGVSGVYGARWVREHSISLSLPFEVYTGIWLENDLWEYDLQTNKWKFVSWLDVFINVTAEPNRTPRTGITRLKGLKVGSLLVYTGGRTAVIGPLDNPAAYDSRNYVSNTFYYTLPAGH